MSPSSDDTPMARLTLCYGDYFPEVIKIREGWTLHLMDEDGEMQFAQTIGYPPDYLFLGPAIQQPRVPLGVVAQPPGPHEMAQPQQPQPQAQYHAQAPVQRNCKTCHLPLTALNTSHRANRNQCKPCRNTESSNYRTVRSTRDKHLDGGGRSACRKCGEEQGKDGYRKTGRVGASILYATVCLVCRPKAEEREEMN